MSFQAGIIPGSRNVSVSISHSVHSSLLEAINQCILQHAASIILPISWLAANEPKRVARSHQVTSNNLATFKVLSGNHKAFTRKPYSCSDHSRFLHNLALSAISTTELLSQIRTASTPSLLCHSQQHCQS